MKKQKIVTEENYKQIVLKRMIILCWITLLICFIIKIFGGNFFNIIISTETYTKYNKIFDTGLMYYISRYVLCQIGTFIYLLAVTRQTYYNFKTFMVILVINSMVFIVKCFNQIVGLVLDITILEIAVPLVIRRNLKSVIIGVVLLNSFQLISLFVKNLGIFKVLDTTFIIGFIYSLDYYLMLFIYYLYNNLRKEENMGLFGLGWLKDTTNNLKALREMLTDDKQKAILNAEIEKLEKKGK